MSKTYTLTPEIDPVTDEMTLTFPDALMVELGWQPGDTLKWEIHEDGTVHLRKIENDIGL